MTLEDAILEVLKRDGPGNVKNICAGLERHVYDALQRLVKADQVKKTGPEGKGHEKTYSLPPAPRFHATA